MKTELANEQIALDPEDQARVEVLTKDLCNGSAKDIARFGQALQEQTGPFTERMLAIVSPEADVGVQLSELNGVLKKTELSAAESFLIQDSEKRKRRIANKYEQHRTELEEIITGLQMLRIRITKNIAALKRLEEECSRYQRELTFHLLAAAKAAALIPEGVEHRKLEARIHDLNISYELSRQTSAQAGITRNNERILKEKIELAVAGAVPLWKTQLAADLMWSGDSGPDDA